MRPLSIAFCFAATLLGAQPMLAAGSGKTRSAAKPGLTVRLMTRDGKSMEGTLSASTLDVAMDGKVRKIALKDVASIGFAAPATPAEQAHITADLATVAANTDRVARERAVGELTDIGLPVLSPLLDTYKDTDMHEPYPLYRLFSRIVPGYADAADRSLDLVRLADGSAMRGKVMLSDLQLAVNGTTLPVTASSLRGLAVRRSEIVRTFDVQALRHCVQIEFLDSGVVVTPESKIEENTQGIVRLSFGIDGWLSDPDGLKVPGPHYTSNIVEGFPFGALLGRIGADGPRFFAGHHMAKAAPSTGRLYFGVNDNPHWQNNIGSFRVKLRVTDGYDLGDPQ